MHGEVSQGIRDDVGNDNRVKCGELADDEKARLSFIEGQEGMARVVSYPVHQVIAGRAWRVPHIGETDCVAGVIGLEL
jgi:hypothetical protein